jgi:hypothetical protein
MSHDDDDIDDQALRALRPVWLAMPDEEPPSRGLDALMAAARVKADEMKAAGVGHVAIHERASASSGATSADQPSWWARLLAMFQRPQVLALATIMILIGGAVFISQRRDKLQHQPEPSAPASTPPQLEVTAEAPPSAQSAGSAAFEGAVGGATTGEQEARQGAPGADASKDARERTDRADAKATASTPVSPTITSGDRAQPRAEPKATVSKKATKAPGKTTTASGGGAAGGRVANDKAETQLLDEEADFSTKGPATGSTATSSTAPVEEQKQEAGEPSVKQLHERARTAATRGDCATARALAKQIARLDAPYYRTNIAPDKTLATCLN